MYAILRKTNETNLRKWQKTQFQAQFWPIMAQIWFPKILFCGFYLYGRCQQCHIQSYFEAGILVWIPNSDPQTLKSVDFWCKFSSPFIVAEPRERCVELVQNVKQPKFSGAQSLDPTGEGLQRSPDYPAAQRFFSLPHLSKNRHPPKITGYGTGQKQLQAIIVCNFKEN